MLPQQVIESTLLEDFKIGQILVRDHLNKVDLDIANIQKRVRKHKSVVH